MVLSHLLEQLQTSYMQLQWFPSHSLYFFFQICQGFLLWYSFLIWGLCLDCAKEEGFKEIRLEKYNNLKQIGQ